MTTSVKRGLHLGLDSLLSDRAKSLAKGEVLTTSTTSTKQTTSESPLKQLPIDKLDRGVYQPRQNFNEEQLHELADSIREQGVISPIIVRQKSNGRYEIIAGERRFRAARLAGLETVPVIVRDLADEPTFAVALIENIQRQDLNVLEEAAALQRLVHEFSLSQEDVAKKVGRSRSAVANIMRLLKLVPEVQALVRDHLLEMGHARALLSLETHQQFEIGQQVANKQLSVRETEEWVKAILSGKGRAKKTEVTQSADILSLQNTLSETLSAKVLIKHSSSGKGKLEIFYHSVDELEGILENFKK